MTDTKTTTAKDLISRLEIYPKNIPISKWGIATLRPPRARSIASVKTTGELIRWLKRLRKDTVIDGFYVLLTDKRQYPMTIEFNTLPLLEKQKT